MSPRDQGPFDVVRDLIAAGQQATDARLDAMSQLLDRAAQDAQQANSTAQEVRVILREQDALAKIAEVKGEAANAIAAMRQDMVLANNNLKRELAAVDARLKPLEEARRQAQGMGRLMQVAGRVIELGAAVGLGGLVSKFWGG